MKNEIYNYEGNGITFQNSDGTVMGNATQMAKSFNKKTHDFFRLKSTSKFITELSTVKGIPSTGLIQTIQGGSNQGAWIHENLAMEYARWLSPKFSIWCNDKIKQLLKTGKAEFNNSDEDQAILNAMMILKQRTTAQSKELQLQAPKVNYYNDVLQSDSTYTTTQIAKELGRSGVSLNRELFALKIQYKQSDTWMLYSKYQNKGFTKTKTHVRTGSDGQQKTSMQTVWTEKGREFIHDRLNA